MDELTLAVVGIDFPNADKSGSSRRMELLLCAPGEPVDLRREPDNPHDPNAVAVFSIRGVQLGYLSADRAPFIGRRLQREESHAVFQALAGAAAYVRIRFGGGHPALPDTTQAALEGQRPRSSAFDPAAFDQDAFYPDPDGPEWGA